MTKRIAAEFFGTLWLVLGGCGSAVIAAAFPDVGIGLAGVALASVKALQDEVHERDQRIQALEARLAELEDLVRHGQH